MNSDLNPVSSDSNSKPILTLYGANNNVILNARFDDPTKLVVDSGKGDGFTYSLINGKTWASYLRGGDFSLVNDCKVIFIKM